MDKKLILMLSLLIVIPLAYAVTPDPGHDASSVGSGTFSSGNFIFQNNVSILNSLFVGALSNPLYQLTAYINGTNRMLVERSGQTIMINPNFANSNTYAVIGTETNMPLAFTTNNAVPEQLWIQNGTGRIGIGTTSPRSNLHVKGNMAIENGTLDLSGSISYDGGYRLRADNPSGNLYIQSRDEGRYDFTILNTSGYVGVGTQSPEYILDIRGATNRLLQVYSTNNNPTIFFNASLAGVRTAELRSRNDGQFDLKDTTTGNSIWLANLTNGNMLFLGNHSFNSGSGINASYIKNAPWLTSYTDTNDTVRVAALESSNTTQDTMIDNLQTDNTTQGTLISALRTDNTTQAAQIAILTTDNATQADYGVHIISLDLSNTTQATAITGLGTDNTTQGTLISALRTDNTTQSGLINLKALTGNCANGQAVMNTTTSGVQCVTVLTTDTNDTIRVAALESSNTTQSTAISGLQTDNTTQGTLISALRTDNTTQGSQIVALQTDNTTQSGLINLRTIAGTCTNGNVVMNTTTSGVQCIAQATDTWNTTAQMQAAVNGSYMNSANYFGYPWSSLTTFPAKCSAGQAVINLSSGACSTFLTTYTDTNDTVRVAALESSNTTQATAITGLGTDNTTQSGLINAKVVPLTCSGNQVVQTTTTSGGTCLTVALTDTDTWNTTTQMIAANNGTYLNAANFFGYSWTGLTTYPAKCAAGQAVVNLSSGACSAFLTSESNPTTYPANNITSGDFISYYTYSYQTNFSQGLSARAVSTASQRSLLLVNGAGTVSRWIGIAGDSSFGVRTTDDSTYELLVSSSALDLYGNKLNDSQNSVIGIDKPITVNGGIIASSINATLNASYIQNSPWLTIYTDTNDTVRVAALESSNTTQATAITGLGTDNSTQGTLISALRTDNTTQSGLINLRVIAGACTNGNVVMNTTTSGVQCIAQTTDTDTWNTTTQMFNAVNNSASLTIGNLSLATDVLISSNNMLSLNNSARTHYIKMNTTGCIVIHSTTSTLNIC
jgi:hypothetical protein